MFLLQEYCEEPSNVPPLSRSKPKIPIDELMEATKPMKPFAWDKETDMSVGFTLQDYIENLFKTIFSIFR